MKTRNGSTKFLIIPSGDIEEIAAMPAQLRQLPNGKWVLDHIVGLFKADEVEIIVEGEDGLEYDSPEDAFENLMDMQNG